MKISPLVVLAPAAAAGVLPRSGSAKALYFLDNNPAGASIVSLKISSKDGTLSDPGRTSTGGGGRYGMTAMGVGAGGESRSSSFSPLSLLFLSSLSLSLSGFPTTFTTNTAKPDTLFSQDA